MKLSSFSPSKNRSSFIKFKTRTDVVNELESTRPNQFTKRTKVIASLNEMQINEPLLEKMLEHGVDAFSIDMSFIREENLKKLSEIRRNLELKRNNLIPLIMYLKGNNVRLTNFFEQEIIVNEGQEIRIGFLRNGKSNHEFLYIDDKEFINNVEEKDHIYFESFENCLTVLRKEKYTTNSEQFKENLDNLNQNNSGYLNKINSFSNGQREKTKTFHHLYKSFKSNKQENQSKKINAIVCKADRICVLKSRMPLFIGKENMKESLDEIDEYDSNLTAKDINDISLAKFYDIDCIALPNVENSENINEVKEIIGKYSKIKVISVIQNEIGLDNWQQIILNTDMLIIARSFLTTTMPVEKFYYKQNELISFCHTNLKPVIIATQLLESMNHSIIPSCCEMSDISNLILSYIDCLMLTSEISHGRYPFESIQTLNRLIDQTENLQKTNLINDHLDTIVDTISDNIPKTIAHCCINAANFLKAKLIIVITMSGLSALNISKLKSKFPIIAIVSSEKVARNLNLLSSVRSILVGSLNGSDVLIDKAIKSCLSKNFLSHDDYIVVTTGDIEASGMTNTLKFIQV